MTKHHKEGLDHRTRDNNGTIREKRSDTKVDTLRKTYGDNFALGVRSDMKLGTLKEKLGVDTLSDILKKK